MLYANGTVYALARSLDSETRIVAVNIGTQAAQVTLDLAGLGVGKGDTRSAQASHRLLYGIADLNWHEQTLSLTLPARQGIIL